MIESSNDRLFIAIWPNSEVRGQLSKFQKKFHLNKFGRCIPAQNFHITVLFLGNALSEKTPELIDIVNEMKVQPFSIELNHVGSWPRNSVAWVGCSQTPPELIEISRQLRKKLKLKKERRKFVPHITLARKFQRKIHHKIEPILWSVNEVTLVRSILSSAGAHYTIIAKSQLV